MKLEAFNLIIAKAINDYLKNLAANSSEINTALLIRTLPPTLDQLIQQAVETKIKDEKNKHIRKLYKNQRAEQKTLLQNMSIAEVKSQIDDQTTTLWSLTSSRQRLQQQKEQYLSDFLAITNPPERREDPIELWSKKRYDDLLAVIKSFDAPQAQELSALMKRIYEYEDGQSLFWRHFDDPIYKKMFLQFLTQKYWATEIKLINAKIDNIQSKMDVLSKEISRLNCILSMGTDTNDLVEMKNMLIPKNQTLLTEQMDTVKNQFDPEAHSHEIFTDFVLATLPLIENNPAFNQTLIRYHEETKREAPFLQKKLDLIQVITNHLITMGGNNSKSIRLKDLKQRFDAIQIDHQTTANDFIQAIYTWQMNRVEGHSNGEAFKPSFFARFFPCYPNADSILITQCLALVNDKPQVNKTISIPQDKQPMMH